MLFSSLEFIFRFLPVFLLIYYLVPSGAKNHVLFFGSLIFYALGEPIYVFLMLATITVNYLLAREKLKKNLIIIFILDIGSLIFFKYTGLIKNLPLGISFYTFQVLSYAVDVYKGKIKREKSFIDFGAYVSMFPQLIAGPIVKYDEVSSKLKDFENRCSLDKFQTGLRIFILGLSGKVLLANRFGQIWDSMAERGYYALPTAVAWFGIVSYTLQIYFDFCGYSMMAIGLGKMLGFDFPRNFDSPYAAKSVTDFWRRWHMTLTGWFREYVYIPLGGNKKGMARTLFNMLIVWAITGIWHGATVNFLLWGLYYFVFLAIERVGLHKFLEKSRILSHIYTLLVVICGWVLFALSDFEDIAYYFKSLFSFNGFGDVTTLIVSYCIVFACGIILSTPLIKRFYKYIKNSIFMNMLLVILFLMCIIQLTDAVYNPFLYFRF